MMDELPLEYPLLRRLPEVGIQLKERVYREQLDDIARQDDEINRMLGMRTSDDYRRVPAEKLSDAEKLWRAVLLFNDKELGKLQKDLASGEKGDMFFNRTGFRSPWRILYEAYKISGKREVEYATVHYNEMELFYIGNGNPNETVAAKCWLTVEEKSRFPVFIPRSVDHLAEKFDGGPFNPEEIAEEIVRLIRRENE